MQLIKSNFYLLMLIVMAIQAQAYPVSVPSCNRNVTFESPPQRAVSNDINLTEIMLVLELEDNMVGYSGIRNKNKISPEFRDKLDNLEEISPDYSTKEDLLGAEADFYFAGWNYGLKINGEVTPDSLKQFGIQVYELTESCIHIINQPEITLQSLYNDLINLGVIFGVEEKAKALIAQYEEELQSFQAELNIGEIPPRVFVYDSGESDPFTAGRYAMPNALVNAAGGRNIMNKVNRSWTTVSIEEIISGNPELIIIVDYGEVTAVQKRNFLINHPAFQNIQAIKDENFLILDYSEVTPGPRNIEAIKKIGQALWNN